MAARGSGGSIASAVGVAAGAGAAQIGLGYGLGIIAWPAEAGGSGESAWVASLAWAVWIAATSVAAGAICADRLRPAAVAVSTLEGREAVRYAVTAALWRAALAIAAAIGALVTVPLVAVPAREVHHPASSVPETIAGGYAVVGVVIGLVVALGALASRAVATNVIASVSWLWLLAVVAVVDGVTSGRGLATAQLAVWHFTSDGPVQRNIDVWQSVLTLGAALLIGLLAALPAARRGDNNVGVAISGGVGPVLVAAAYFLAAPTLSGIPARELSAYLVAPYAVLAGLAGSVLVAALGPRLKRRTASPDGGSALDAWPTREPKPLPDSATDVFASGGTSTAGTSTAGTSTAGTSTAGTSTAGTSTAGTSTAGTDAGSSAVDVPKPRSSRALTSGSATSTTAGSTTTDPSTAGSPDGGSGAAGSTSVGSTAIGTASVPESTSGPARGRRGKR